MVLRVLLPTARQRSRRSSVLLCGIAFRSRYRRRLLSKLCVRQQAIQEQVRGGQVGLQRPQQRRFERVETDVAAGRWQQRRQACSKEPLHLLPRPFAVARCVAVVVIVASPAADAAVVTPWVAPAPTNGCKRRFEVTRPRGPRRAKDRAVKEAA